MKMEKVGPVVRGVIEIHDSAPPSVVSALAGNDLNTLNLVFSKPLDPVTAVDVKNYVVQPSLAISNISQSPDGRNITLTFAGPIPDGTGYTLSLSGIKDKTADGNVIAPTTQFFNAQNIAYSLKSAQLPSQPVKVQVAGLPLQSGDAWTMNMLVKPDQAPDNRSFVAGFGQGADNQNGGTNRYFSVFDGSITFGLGVRTGSPLEVGRWQMLTATYDGKTVTVYKDGDPIGDHDVELGNDSESSVNIGTASFHGAVQDFTIRRGAFTAAEVKQLFAKTKPDQ